MSGFVGVRARKRRRNIFLTLGFLIIVASIYFIFPTFQFNMNDPVPDENLIPDPTEDLTSLASDIEDLELIVFQKDQKIKFRDGQINNLKIQLQDNKAQLENTIKELDNIKGLYAAIISSNDNSVPLDDLNILQDKFNALNKENEKNIVEINNLNNQIKDLDNNLLSVDQNQKDVKIENQKLKQENKSLFAKNLKLNETISNLENEINEQRIEVEMYLEKIKELKDKSHHGG